MKITQLNGNADNGIKGSRITVRASDGKLIDRFVVPSRYGGVAYCKSHPKGRYGCKYFEAIRKCLTYEEGLNTNG